MISITLKSYWRVDGPVSSTSYAMKDGMEQAQKWIQRQVEHSNKQGFSVTWQVFDEYGNCVDRGQSESKVRNP